MSEAECKEVWIGLIWEMARDLLPAKTVPRTDMERLRRVFSVGLISGVALQPTLGYELIGAFEISRRTVSRPLMYSDHGLKPLVRQALCLGLDVLAPAGTTLPQMICSVAPVLRGNVSGNGG